MEIQLMQKHLYFVCPTDCLEPVINKSCGNKNYFYTSLGNSVVFDQDTTMYLRQMLLKHNIQEISFVLSITNPIITDALKNQDFMDIRGLSNFYDKVIRQKGHSNVLANEQNRRFTIISYHLNQKIKELQRALDGLNIARSKIRGKIYNGKENVFDEIYSHLVCTEYFSLN